MSEVVNLWTGEPASIAGNQYLIEMLESLLGRARDGLITAAGFAIVNGDGSIATRWSGGDQTVPMIAAISMLQHEFLAWAGNR